jgi:hypothetical protein
VYHKVKAVDFYETSENNRDLVGVAAGERHQRTAPSDLRNNVKSALLSKLNVSEEREQDEPIRTSRIQTTTSLENESGQESFCSALLWPESFRGPDLRF